MKNFRGVHLVFFVALAFMLHLPVAFSRDIYAMPSLPAVVEESDSKASESSAVFETLDLAAAGLSREAFDAAVCGFERLRQKGAISNDNIISIADMSKPSSAKRLFIIDLENKKILFKTFVAHGMGSGELMAKKFSNVAESHTSSPGFYRTSSTYIGKHGYSLHLSGLEKGINDRAEERAIVVHGADYVSEGFINSHGFLGRSHGCPAVPTALSKPIINTIKGGSCLFIYTADAAYRSASRLLS